MPSNRPSNRLIAEKSPYLLQHAHNPVDWYPWGEEAFAKAKRENKPVLVSIGYSTCHWCHVMARESFEDEATARLLNENYVAIKVDREERPDIDAVYMTVCQALTGQGGWPLNVFLTPDQKPFYAGTYFPKENVYGRPSFKDVLLSLKRQYDADPKKITAVGAQIVAALSGKKERDRDSLSEKVLHQAAGHFMQTFDNRYGGFGQAPKFPSPHQLLFLLRYSHWQKDERSLDMVLATLDGMAAGGIHDQIGGGFARYSVDEKWLVPHFEKMLYDQALIALAYTEAYQVSGNERYQTIVEHLFSYVVRELRDEKGGFYCAEDADSEGAEGKYYVWSPEEVFAVLGEEQGLRFCRAYHVTEAGNFARKSIPNLIGTPLAQLAAEEGCAEEEYIRSLNEAKQKLLEARNKRIHPHKDDKILTSWNALIIAAFAKAGKVFNCPAYIQLAEEALRFIETKLTEQGRLMARYRDGEAKHRAYLDDYAFLALACHALYEATYHPDFLLKMKRYADQMVAEFWDEKAGGFYLYSRDAENLILKPKEVYDGAIPSGNSAAAYALLLLSGWTGDMADARRAETLFSVFASEVDAYPAGYTFLLSAFLLSDLVPKQLIVVKGESEQKFQSALARLRRLYLPDVAMFAGDRQMLAQISGELKDYAPLEGETTFFLCENFQCRRPTTDLEDVISQLVQVQT